MVPLALAIAFVVGAVVLLLVEVLWPTLTVYLTGLHVGYRLSESEYDLAIVSRLLGALDGGLDDGRLSAEQRRIVRQAIDEQFPGFRIGPGYQYDQGANKFLIALSIPLPVFNQNQGPIAKARAHRALAAARFRDIQQKALAAIDTAAADWQASRRAETEARRAAATARSRAHRARLAFQAGATGRLALFEAERSAVVGRQQTLLAEAQRLRALGNLADALHHPFFGGGTR